MFTLIKEFRFEASHVLPNHGGKCRRLHGHSWKGFVIVEAPDLIPSGPCAGMVMDFGDLKEIVGEVVEKYLDHFHLNETLPLTNPTSEAIARWIYHRIQGQVVARADKVRQGCGPLSLTAVQIEETCTSACTYQPRPARSNESEVSRMTGGLCS